MEQPPIFCNSNKDVQSIIIYLGSGIYTHICGNHTSDEILHNLKSNQKIEKLKKIISELKESQIQERLSTNQKILLDRQMNKETHEKEIEMLKKFHEKDLEQVNKSMKEKDEIIKRDQLYMDTFIGQRSFKNTKEQGDHAEKWLQSLVNKGFPFDNKSTFEDTSGIYGSGDLIIYLPKYNIRIMVEVKNKTAIDEDDLEQFKEHYQKDFQENKIDLCILLSFNCKNIRGYGCCTAYKRDKQDKRVIYYSFSNSSSLSEKEDKLIDTLEEICEKYQESNNVPEIKQQETMKQIIERTFKNIKSAEVYLQQEEKMKQKSLDVTKQRKTQIMNDKHTFLKELWEQGNLELLEKQFIQGDETFFKTLIIQKIKKEMEFKQVELCPMRKNGQRPGWQKKLIEDLQLSLEGYESEIFHKKIKHTDITN